MSDLNSLIQLGSDLGFQMESDYDDFATNNETPDFMSSEFFDSILSMGKDEAGTNDMELGECGLSTYSDSGLSSEPNADQLLSDEELFSVCSMLEQTASSDGSEAGDPSYTVPLSPPQPAQPAEPALLLTKPAAVVAPNLKPIQQLQTKPKVINIIKPTPKQVLKIQTMGGNQRSLLLPINIKDLKTIKIINTNNMKAEELKITSTSARQASVCGTESPAKRPAVQAKRSAPCAPDRESDDPQYPMLVLTPEEKRLLCKDGIQLPLRYPLSKTQERELKRIRRKIRNKISAQDSRKRKKEYVDGLEERVKQCSEENRSLLKKIKLLQTQNNKLSSQLSKLQALIFKSGTSRAHPATCLLIVVLSVMLVSLPNLRNLSNDKELNSLQQFAARRALLFDQQATNEDLLAAERPPLGAPADEANKTRKQLGELFAEIGRSIMAQLGADDTGGGPAAAKADRSAFEANPRPGDPPRYDGKATRKRTIEFEVDESWPPEKKNATNLIRHVL